MQYQAWLPIRIERQSLVHLPELLCRSGISCCEETTSAFPGSHQPTEKRLILIKNCLISHVISHPFQCSIHKRSIARRASSFIREPIHDKVRVIVDPSECLLKIKVTNQWRRSSTIKHSSFPDLQQLLLPRMILRWSLRLHRERGERAAPERPDYPLWSAMTSKPNTLSEKSPDAI